MIFDIAGSLLIGLSFMMSIVSYDRSTDPLTNLATNFSFNLAILASILSLGFFVITYYSQANTERLCTKTKEEMKKLVLAYDPANWKDWEEEIESLYTPVIWDRTTLGNFLLTFVNILPFGKYSRAYPELARFEHPIYQRMVYKRELGITACVLSSAFLVIAFIPLGDSSNLWWLAMFFVGVLLFTIASMKVLSLTKEGFMWDPTLAWEKFWMEKKKNTIHTLIKSEMTDKSPEPLIGLLQKIDFLQQYWDPEKERKKQKSNKSTIAQLAVLVSLFGGILTIGIQILDLLT